MADIDWRVVTRGKRKNFIGMDSVFWAWFASIIFLGTLGATLFLFFLKFFSA